MELDHGLLGAELLVVGGAVLRGHCVRRKLLSAESDTGGHQVAVFRRTCEEARRSEGQEYSAEEETKQA